MGSAGRWSTNREDNRGGRRATARHTRHALQRSGRLRLAVTAFRDGDCRHARDRLAGWRPRSRPTGAGRPTGAATGATAAYGGDREGRRHQTDVVVAEVALPGWRRRSRHGCRACRSSCWKATHPPIDKVCGEGLMPEAWPPCGARASTSRLSTVPPCRPPVRGRRTEVDARFPSGIGVGIRRPLLHQASSRVPTRSGW